MAFDFGSFINSPGGAAGINALGSALGAYGQAQRENASRKQNAAATAAQIRQSDYWNQQSQNTNRAAGVLAADPLGADQRYAQRNALLGAILPNLRNVKSAPGDPSVAAAMGSRPGLTPLPEGGLDPAMIKSFYGPEATMAAIAKRNQQLTSLDPRAPQSALDSMYGEDAAAPYMAQMKDWATKAQAADAETRAQYEQQITQLINTMAQQEENGKKGGFWRGLARVAGLVGGVAAVAMTGGAAAPFVAPLVGAASGAASSWGAGGNPLMGAITGGITPAARGMIPSLFSQSPQTAVNQTAQRIYKGVQ